MRQAQSSPIKKALKLPPSRISRLDERTVATLRDEGFDLPELIELFVSEVSVVVGAIAEAFGRNDLKAVASQAHRLKGSAATIGARGMSELCASLQGACDAGEFSRAQALFGQLALERDRVSAALRAEGKKATSINVP